MGNLFRYFFFAIAAGCAIANATEVLHPITAPGTWVAIDGAAELDEDIYSADMTLSAEFALPMLNGTASIYADGSFRFLSYSYEYSTEGYIHNYCNLHVNGFNETYVGTKFMPFVNSSSLKGFGLNLNWRFPPGEGSQLNRFHRLNIEPFFIYNFSKKLHLGSAILYNTFLEQDNFAPGDEIGLKASLTWKFGWNQTTETGWIFNEILLYKARIQESQNKHLSKPYRKMDDKYQGMKMRFDLARVFGFAPVPVSFGLNYEIHHGTLFGFETGHRVGIFAKAGL